MRLTCPLSTVPSSRVCSLSSLKCTAQSELRVSSSSSSLSMRTSLRRLLGLGQKPHILARGSSSSSWVPPSAANSVYSLSTLKETLRLSKTLYPALAYLSLRVLCTLPCSRLILPWLARRMLRKSTLRSSQVRRRTGGGYLSSVLWWHDEGSWLASCLFVGSVRKRVDGRTQHDGRG